MSKEKKPAEHDKKQTASNKWQEFAAKQGQEQEQEEVEEVVKMHEQDTETQLQEQLPHTTIEDLENQLNAVEAERDELKNELLKLHASMKNLEARSAREIEKAHKFANDRLIRELLPIVDSFERGLEHEVSQDPKLQAMRDGMMMTLDMLLKMLNKFGVVVIYPEVGEPFNPEEHEAMSAQVDATLEPDAIIQVLQKGFALNGRVIRAAMVIVNKAK